MVHVPKEKRLKWDKKSERKILVGYSENVKGYRVFDPVKKKISISRDVIVIEKTDKSKEEVNKENEEIPVSVGEDPPTEMEIAQEEKEDDTQQDLTDNDTETNTSTTDVNSILDGENDESDYSLEEEITEPGENEPVRRSQRVPKPKIMKDYVTYMCANTTNSDVSDPVTVAEAMSSADSAQWRQAMQEEIDAFEENSAWELVNMPSQCSVVQCKWVFKKKIDAKDNVRYRARLVAKGFTQKYGTDFDETFSPVVRHSTLRILIAISVNLGLDITHLDVVTAFLNGNLSENVYMQQPEEFIVLGQENKILKLNKAIYGLKQSSRVWYQKVETV